MRARRSSACSTTPNSAKNWGVTEFQERVRDVQRRLRRRLWTRQLVIWVLFGAMLAFFRLEIVDTYFRAVGFLVLILPTIGAVIDIAFGRRALEHLRVCASGEELLHFSTEAQGLVFITLDGYFIERKRNSSLLAFSPFNGFGYETQSVEYQPDQHAILIKQVQNISVAGEGGMMVVPAWQRCGCPPASQPRRLAML